MPAYIYRVAGIGDGTELNPYRPDIPAGTPMVGQQISTTLWLVKTTTPLPPAGGRVDITSDHESVCEANGVDCEAFENDVAIDGER